MPIWDYGKNDRLIQHEMVHILIQLKMKGTQQVVDALLEKAELTLKNNK